MGTASKVTDLLHRCVKTAFRRNPSNKSNGRLSRPNVGHSFKLTYPPPCPKYPNSLEIKLPKLELSNIGYSVTLQIKVVRSKKEELMLNQPVMASFISNY